MYIYAYTYHTHISITYIYTYIMVLHRPPLCNPMDCRPGSSVHGIFQAGILEWIAISFPNIYYIYTHTYIRTVWLPVNTLAFIELFISMTEHLEMLYTIELYAINYITFFHGEKNIPSRCHMLKVCHIYFTDKDNCTS